MWGRAGRAGAGWGPSCVAGRPQQQRHADTPCSSAGLLPWVWASLQKTLCGPKGGNGCAGSGDSSEPSKREGKPSTKGRNCLPERPGTAFPGDTGPLSPLLESIVGFPEIPHGWSPHGLGLLSPLFSPLTRPQPPRPPPCLPSKAKSPSFLGSGISCCGQLAWSTYSHTRPLPGGSFLPVLFTWHAGSQFPNQGWNPCPLQ